MNRRTDWPGGAAALGAGVLLVGPLTAAAQDDGDDWVDDALTGLVADGTLTAAAGRRRRPGAGSRPADTDARRRVTTVPGPGRPRRALGGVRGPAPPRRGGDRHRHRARRVPTSSVTVRPSPRWPRPRRRAPAVIDAMVAAAKARIDEAVADGRIAPRPPPRAWPSSTSASRRWSRGFPPATTAPTRPRSGGPRTTPTATPPRNVDRRPRRSTDHRRLTVSAVPVGGDHRYRVVWAHQSRAAEVTHFLRRKSASRRNER